MMMRTAWLVVVTAVWATSATAQLPETRLGSVYPPGGSIGTSFDVHLSGVENLEYETAPRLHFSHPGITAEPILDPETGVWRENAFRVTAAASVPAGRYDLFLSGWYGVSNPRSFRLDAGGPSQVEAEDWSESAPAVLPMNAPAYGRIGAAADVDAFTFSGEAGTTIVVRCQAALLDSPLQPVIELIGPDGRRFASGGGAFYGEAILPIVLPTDGEYRVRLTDAAYRGGDAFVYRMEVTTQPIIESVHPSFDVPGATTEFTLLGYNLPGGEPDESEGGRVRRTVTVELPPNGSELPALSLLASARAGVDGCDHVFRDTGLTSEPVPVFFSAIPPELEHGTDDAQSVTVPAEIAGQFEKRGDIDSFDFEASAGDVVFVEVFAKRYGSPADPVLTIDQLTGPDGEPKRRRIATADDQAENLAPGVFDTATDDPLIRLDVPENGRYRVAVHDRYFTARGDDSLFYRLSLRAPRPDFRLFAVPHTRDDAKKSVSPDAVNLRRGESVAIPVFLMRRDGFHGAVRVGVENLPTGLSTSGMTLAEGQTSGTLVLTATRDAASWTGPIAIVGEATLPDAVDPPSGSLQRQARVGTIVRGDVHGQAESRLTGSLQVAVLDDAVPFRLESESQVLRVGQGSQVLLPLHVVRDAGFAETINVTLDGLSADSGIATEITPFGDGQDRQLGRLTVAAQAPPRSYQLLFHGSAKIEATLFPHRLERAEADSKAASEATVRQVDYRVPSSPVSLTIVPAPVELKAEAAAEGRVSRGGFLEIKVTITRREGFTGPVRLSLALPEATPGLTAEPVTISADAREATLKIEASKDAPEGAAAFAAIRADAEQNGAVRIDVPVSLTVVP